MTEEQKRHIIFQKTCLLVTLADNSQSHLNTEKRIRKKNYSLNIALCLFFRTISIEATAMGSSRERGRKSPYSGTAIVHSICII